MIVLGNEEFAMAMKLAGMKQSYVIRKKEDTAGLLKELNRDELIIANVSVIKMVPELKKFRNLVSIPDHAQEFGRTDDLKDTIKSAVGIEIKV